MESTQGNLLMAKPGLYANIHAKRKRIAAGSKEKMRKVGSKGAPTADNFKQAAMKDGGNVCNARKKLSSGLMKNYSSEGKKYGGSANMPNPRKPMGTM